MATSSFLMIIIGQLDLNVSLGLKGDLLIVSLPYYLEMAMGPDPRFSTENTLGDGDGVNLSSMGIDLV